MGYHFFLSIGLVGVESKYYCSASLLFVIQEMSENFVQFHLRFHLRYQELGPGPKMNEKLMYDLNLKNHTLRLCKKSLTIVPINLKCHTNVSGYNFGIFL